MCVMFVDGFEDVIAEVCWETSIYSVSPPFCFFVQQIKQWNPLSFSLVNRKVVLFDFENVLNQLQSKLQ